MSAVIVQLLLKDRLLQEVPFATEVLSIGRMKENDVVINNLSVSRFHAVLRKDGEHFVLEDKGSENGTFVNGTRIEDPTNVVSGDEIRVGKHKLVLRSGDAAALDATPARGPSDVWDSAQTYFAGPETMAKLDDAPKDSGFLSAGDILEPMAPAEDEETGEPSATSDVVADLDVPGPAADPSEIGTALIDEGPVEEALDDDPLFAEALDPVDDDEDDGEVLDLSDDMVAEPQSDAELAAEEVPFLEDDPASDDGFGSEGDLLSASDDGIDDLFDTPSDDGGDLLDAADDGGADDLLAPAADEPTDLLSAADDADDLLSVGADDADDLLSVGADDGADLLEGPGAEAETSLISDPLDGPGGVAAEADPFLEDLGAPDAAAGAPALSPEPDAGTEAPDQTSFFAFGEAAAEPEVAAAELEHEPLTEEFAAPSDVAPEAPAPEAVYAGLIVQRDGQLERVLAWDQDELEAGRAAECAVFLGSPEISRRHAAFRRAGDRYEVHDLDSINGIEVNGQRLQSAVLNVGDVVRIEDYELTFVIDAQPIHAEVQTVDPTQAAREGDAPFGVTQLHDDITANPALGIEQGPAEVDLLSDDLHDDVDDEKPQDEVEAVVAAPSLELAGETPGVIAAGELSFRIVVKRETLPEPLRRALAELGPQPLRLPVELCIAGEDESSD